MKTSKWREVREVPDAVETSALSRQAAMPRLLQAMPGVEPIGALMIETFAPPMDHFRPGRDFAA